MHIAFFYFIFIGTNGLLGYMPLYYKSLGFSGEQISIIGSLGPLIMVFLPPLWGMAADHSGRPDRALKLACIGATASFYFMLGRTDFAGIVLVLSIYALFGTALSSLADTVAVSEARRLGTDFARLRVWGSVGFIVASYSFGEYLARDYPVRGIVVACFALLLAFTLAVQFLPPVAIQEKHIPPSLRDTASLVANPAFVLFLAAAMIHWAAMTPYYLFFALHIKELKIDPSFIGLGFSLGVVAEVIVMWTFRSAIKRFPIFGLLGLTFVVTALRWFLIASVKSGTVLAIIQIAHGLSFGVFYLGCIAHLERTVPERLQGTGRALFSSVVLGLGGILGNRICGITYDLGGGRMAFLISAALELLAPLVLILSFWLNRKKAGLLRPAGPAQ